MWRGLAFVACVSVSLAQAGAVAAKPRAATRPATTSASKPATSRATTRRGNAVEASRTAIRTAVAALAREYEEFRSSPAEHPLRPSSNYFDKDAAASISPEVLVASL